MPTKPWVTFRQPDPTQEYLVLLTVLPLKRFRDLGAFVVYTLRIVGQLQRTPGVLGYSLLAHVFQSRFWTLSVWESEAALQQFVAENPHDMAMRALQGKMDQTHFVWWSARGSAFPPSWQDALARQNT